MQSSIMAFFAKLFHCLAIWFEESCTGRIFNHISAFLANCFRHSFVGRLFTQTNWGEVFKHSLFCKLLLLPVTLCRLVARHTDSFSKNVASSSGLLFLFENWHRLSIRAYGICFCSFSLCYGALRVVFSFPSVIEWCIITVLFILSLLCILINRSLNSLFQGSRILNLVGGFFCDIKKETESKLFFKEPENIATRPVIGIAIGILAAIIASCMPSFAFLLAVAGVFYVFITMRYTVVGVFTVIIAAPILPTMVLAGCCCLTILSLFLNLATNKDMTLRPVPLGGFIALFTLMLCLATINSFTFVKSVKILFLHLAFILFYFVAFQTLNTKKKWCGALVSFLLVAGLVALYGVYQNFAGVSSTASWVDQEMFQQIKVRVYSTFDNPNVLGEYLVLLIPVMMAMVWKSKTNGQKTVYSGLLLILAACLIFTWSRGAWLGVFLAAAVFLLVMDKRWSLLALVGLCLIPAFLTSDSAIANRLLSIGNTTDTSTAYRVSIWRASLSMLKDFWLCGIGPGSDAFSMIYPKYALAGANFALHSHNLFLQLWVETGICGIASFFALIIAFIRQSFTLPVYQERNRLSPAISMAFAAGILGFLFQGLTDNVWYNYKMVL
ncbi:MAG: O-antigen ligase family protein, partial [Oscillospiraceae bacterium]|nr:O-antigen ligase family protein [Oscillospiraceae bacterium]